MTRPGTLILASGLALALAAACTKQSLKATYDKQSGYIEAFVQGQMKSDTTATLRENGGAYRLLLHDTLKVQRDSLREGGLVSLYYACFTLTGSSVSRNNLVATNLKEVARAAGWDLTDTTRYKLDTVRLDKNLLPGLRYGLEGVQAGDQGYILFTGKLGYEDTERGMIPAKSALAYQIWIDNVKNE